MEAKVAAAEAKVAAAEAAVDAAKAALAAAGPDTLAAREADLRSKEGLLASKEVLLAAHLQALTAEKTALLALQRGPPPPPPRSDYLLSPDVISRVKASVFAIVDDMGAGLGVGAFVGPRMALTAGHNIPEGSSDVRCFLPSDAGRVTRHMAYGEQFSVRVIKKHATFDLAVLELPSEALPRSIYLPLADVPSGADATLGLHVTLCSYLFSIREELDLTGDSFHCRLAVSSGFIMAASAKAHFAIYSANTYAGDSGSALVMSNGGLVGLHLETVNTMQNRLRAKEAQQEDAEWKDSVEGSLAELIQGGSLAGAVALLVDAFRDEVQITDR